MLRLTGARGGEQQKHDEDGNPSDCRSHMFSLERPSDPPNVHAQRPRREQREPPVRWSVLGSLASLNHPIRAEQH